MAALKYRTPEELKNSELNYYIAFGIEPTETDIKKIKEALIKKRNTFKNDVNAINLRLQELQDDIDKVMLEDAVLTDNSDGSKSYALKSGGRKAEADCAKMFYANRAIDMAKSICRSGFIEEFKISEIAKKFFVTEKVVLDGIDSLLKQGVKLIKSVKREVAFGNFKNIESPLKKLGKRNLYDFSELPENSSTKELFEKQEEIYNVSLKKSNDSKGKASIELSGIGKAVFKSDSARREYDTYYKTKTDVWDVLSDLRDSGIKTINDKIFIECFEAFKNKAGLSPDEAEKELHAYLEYFKIAREHANKIKIEVCPYDDCGKSYVYREGIKSCPNCGKSLEVKCWNCGGVSLFISKTQPCAKCGITVKNKIDFDKAQQNFSSLLKTSGVSEIDLEKSLNAMENVYPTYGMIPDSVIARSISAAEKQIEEFKAKQAAKNVINEKYVKDIERLIVQKKYCSAEALIKQLRLEDPSYDVLSDDSCLRMQSEHIAKGGFVRSDFEETNNEISALLENFMADEVAQLLKQFTKYSFFGVSALGENPIDGVKLSGEPNPIRVLDPLLWLLSINKYIKTI